ncbi:SURF1 family protein [Arthrobacter roseus]|uniref:SURF1 family protein n=1 Tax=Arthrobacter roseus TaxID=136274 RepID=UPI0030841A3A|nr:cytochrome oxidase assembly protein ShyY1 [Arthrobacter roseus]
MLKTALKPRWILSLIFALVLASVFVLLSQWQFSQSEGEAPPPPTQTETVRPLTETFKPGDPLYKPDADQRVSIEGSFVAGTQLVIPGRLQDDREGAWVVNAFEVAGAPETAGTTPVIAVVRGWIADDAAAPPEPKAGPAAVVGRLLPTEAPIAGPMPQGQVASLSAAHLVNLWDRPAYSGFVTASDISHQGQSAAVPAGVERVLVGPQPQETPLNWLNIFYAIEWFVFAGFAFFLWWRLVADDYRRQHEDAEDEEVARQSSTSQSQNEVTK